ncbi:MAG: hypothetical protein ACREEW_02620 [Caulobacteraceae bacterium]
MTTLERAFELARSGQCGSVTDVRRMLAAEGYTMAQLDGPALLRQLRELCAASVLDAAKRA